MLMSTCRAGYDIVTQPKISSCAVIETIKGVAECWETTFDMTPSGNKALWSDILLIISFIWRTTSSILWETLGTKVTSDTNSCLNAQYTKQNTTTLKGGGAIYNEVNGMQKHCTARLFGLEVWMSQSHLLNLTFHRYVCCKDGNRII